MSANHREQRPLQQGRPHVRRRRGHGDYKPRPDLTLRLQTDLERTNTETQRFVFAGSRGANPLLFVDVQKHLFGPLTFIRLRKTFD